jgi:hypothetical protein
MLRVRRPIELVVENCWVTETVPPQFELDGPAVRLFLA